MVVAGIDQALGQQFATNYTGGLANLPFFDWVLRNQIIPIIIDGRNNDIPMYRTLMARKKHVAGKYVIQMVRDGRNFAGVSSISPEAHLPDPGRQGAYNYSLGTRNIYCRAKFSGKLMRAAAGDMVAFADYLEYELGGLREDLSIKQEIMLHGDGSGRRAEVSAPPGLNANMTVRMNQDFEGAATITTNAALWLARGMRVAIMTSVGAIKTVGAQQAFYVVAVGQNTVQLSLVLDGTAIADYTVATGGWNIAPAAGDWIVDASRDSSMTTSPVWGDTGFRNEPSGLEATFRRTGVLDGNGISLTAQQSGVDNRTVTAITNTSCGFQGIQVNSGSLPDINGTLFPVAPDFNKAIIADGGGAVRPLDDLLIQRALSDSRRVNRAVVKELWSCHELYDSYVGTLFGDKRFPTNTLRGGHDGDTLEVGGANFNGLTWHKSRFMNGNRLVGLDPEMFSIWENEELRPAVPPGGQTYLQLHDNDQFSTALVTEYNLFQELRNRAGFMLVDVA